jgi:hypothetical protein
MPNQTFSTSRKEIKLTMNSATSINNDNNQRKVRNPRMLYSRLAFAGSSFCRSITGMRIAGSPNLGVLRPQFVHHKISSMAKNRSKPSLTICPVFTLYSLVAPENDGSLGTTNVAVLDTIAATAVLGRFCTTTCSKSSLWATCAASPGLVRPGSYLNFVAHE